MSCVIYAKQNDDISVYEQYNQCATLAKRYGYSIESRVLDFDGTNFHKAVNRVIAECDVVALIIYSKDIVFNDYSEFVFYRIYLDKLNKELIIVK